MAEIWNLLDENGEFTGIKYERGSYPRIGKGLYHLAVEVWVKTSDGLILITQRQKDKKDGLLWETTCGSAIDGESSVEAAKRELFEETGIKVNESELEYMDRIKGTDFYVDVYIVKTAEIANEIVLSLQEREVANSRFVEIDDVMSLDIEYTEAFTKHFNAYKEKIRKK